MSSDVQEYGDHASHHDKAFEALLGPTVSYHNIEDIFYKDFNFETSITSTCKNALLTFNVKNKNKIFPG